MIDTSDKESQKEDEIVEADSVLRKEDLEKIEVSSDKTLEEAIAEDNKIYVGLKSSMAYVLAVMAQFSDGAMQVRLKARGKAISRAVDVVEIVRNKFVKDAKIEDISIGTEELEGDRGVKRKVSTIEIVISKPPVE
jgi:archaea-specific DNA-binding protein